MGLKLRPSFQRFYIILKYCSLKLKLHVGPGVYRCFSINNLKLYRSYSITSQTHWFCLLTSNRDWKNLYEKLVHMRPKSLKWGSSICFWPLVPKTLEPSGSKVSFDKYWCTHSLPITLTCWSFHKPLNTSPGSLLVSKYLKFVLLMFSFMKI